MSLPQFSFADNLAQPDENRITYFAVTDSRGKHIPFGIKREDRSRHTYVIGKTGMGKSHLLETMAIQDIQNGEGICFVDPHGSSAEKLLDYVPEDRVKDVLYFAPFDLQYPVSFNVLEDVGPDKRHFVVAGLMSTFEKIWVDAWSARMAYILQNTLGALLEFPGATLLSVNRMYIDKEYRKNVIAKITDPSVRSFWVDEYSKYTDRYTQEATPAIQNKIGQFAANALVRNIIGQEQSAFDIRSLMDNRKIFIVNLSKGRVGEGNANLLGSMLITKIYLAAMSRADASPSEMRDLPPFYLYVDEFQNFANRSFADILSEARKYKLCLTVAHQYVEQMEEEVRDAVFGNVGTMMTFRVGAYDAEVLEKEFAPVFTADHLVNLGRFQLYLKLMIDGVSSQPFSATTLPPLPEQEVSYRDKAIAFSRAQFSRPRVDVEQGISDWLKKEYEDPEADAKERARQERRAARDAENSGSGPLKKNGNSGVSRGPESTDRPARTRDTRDGPPAPRARLPRSPIPQRKPSPGPAPIEADVPIQDRGLKDLLAQISAAADVGPAPRDLPTGGNPPRVQAPVRKRTAPKPQRVNAPAPSRDDGKGVTDEGKAELRNLLARLSPAAGGSGGQPPRAVEQPAPQPPAPTPTVQPSPAPTPLVQREGDDHASSVAPTPAAQPAPPRREAPRAIHVPIKDENPHESHGTPTNAAPAHHIPIQDVTPHDTRLSAGTDRPAPIVAELPADEVAALLRTKKPKLD